MEESASPLDVPPHSTSTGALHFVMQCRASATDRSEHVERLPSLSCIMQVLHQRNAAHVDSSPTLHVDATTPELEYAAQEGGLELSNEVLERTMLKLTTADQRYESALMHLMEASNWTHGKGEVEPSASTPAGSSKSGSTSLSDSQQRHRRNALERYEAACTGFGVAPLAAVVRRLTATGARTTRPVSFSVAAALADSSSEDATLAGLSAQPTPIASAAGSPTVLYRVPGITPSPASPAISPDAAVSVTMPYLTQGVVDHPSIYDSTQGASPSFFITPRGASAGHTSSGKTRHLNLSSCDYVGSPDHFIPVLRTLEHLIYITSLDLHQTHLQEMCLSVLLHLIESKLHHLEYLDISSNGDITDAIAPQLLGVIRRSRGTIHTLVLHDTAVSARTLRQVAAWCCLEPLRDDRAVFPREGENGLG